MKFHQSGLPNNSMLEDAFNYSFKNVMNTLDESMKSFTQQIGLLHDQHMQMLNADKKSGMKEDEYNMNKVALEKMRDEQLKMGPPMIIEELEKSFVSRRLGPVKEAMSHSDNASPEVLAALLLTECVRSPVDFRNIEKTFGSAVAAIIAEVVHIDAYPSERDANISKASSEVKSTYQVLMITSLDQMTQQIEQAIAANPMQKIMFPPGQEEQIYSGAKLLRGNDKKLDARFIEVFNRASDAASSPYKLEVGTDGDLELIKGAVTPRKGKNPIIPPPKGPGGNGGLGGDVF